MHVHFITCAVRNDTDSHVCTFIRYLACSTSLDDPNTMGFRKVSRQIRERSS